MSKKKFIDVDVFSAMASSGGQGNFQPAPIQSASPVVQNAPRFEAPPRSANEAGLPPGLTRATIIAPKDLLEKCKDIAYWDRLRDQDVYAAALATYVAAHEKQTGRAVEPRPTHARRTAVRAPRNG